MFLESNLFYRFPGSQIPRLPDRAWAGPWAQLRDGSAAAPDHFFFFLEARIPKQPHPSAADRVRGGGTAPQIHMQVGPHSSRCCRKGPQGATPRTRPPAPLPLGRRPQAAWSVHCTTRRPRTLVPAPSIKRISSSNPEGPLRDGCRRPAPPSTSGLFYPDARLSEHIEMFRMEFRHDQSVGKVLISKTRTCPDPF